MGDLWRDLTTLPPATDTFNVPALLYGALFAAGFLVAVFLANQGARRLVAHPVTRRAVQRLANIGTYVFAAGLFFFGVRALNINPFSFGAPLWMVLSIVAVVTFVAYCFRYWTSTYPANLRAYEEQQLKKRYLQPQRARQQPKPAPAAKPAARERAK